MYSFDLYCLLHATYGHSVNKHKTQIKKTVNSSHEVHDDYMNGPVDRTTTQNKYQNVNSSHEVYDDYAWSSRQDYSTDWPSATHYQICAKIGTQ